MELPAVDVMYFATVGYDYPTQSASQISGNALASG
jgi:hypothetical protein